MSPKKGQADEHQGRAGGGLIKVLIFPRMGVPPLSVPVPVSFPLTIVTASPVAPKGTRDPLISRISVTIPIIRARVVA